MTCVLGQVIQQPIGATGAPRGHAVQQRVTATSAITFSGTVRRDGRAISNVRLRLRNVDTGTIAGETVSGANGDFSFAIPAPGSYIVEAVDKDGRVMALSTASPVSTASVIGDVILSSGHAVLWVSTALLVVSAAAGSDIHSWISGGGGGGGSVGPNVVSPER